MGESGRSGDVVLEQIRRVVPAVARHHVKIPDSYRYAVQAGQQERTQKTIEDHIEGGTFCIGDPDTCIRTIKKYEEVGIDQVLCFMQFGRLPHQKIMESTSAWAGTLSLIFCRGCRKRR